MDTCSWKFICRAHFLSPGISSDLYLSTIIWLVYCQHGILPQIINPTCTCWVISSQKAKRKTSLSLKNKNKLHVVYTCNWNFSTMNARALIFYMSIPCDNACPWVPNFFTMCPWTWIFKTLTLQIAFEQWVLRPFKLIFFVTRTFWKYQMFLPCRRDLANSFWSVSARALIFHMGIPCDKIFPCIPTFFTLWHWTRSFAYFLNKLSMLITWQQWVLGFSYFTSIFLK